jgi:hypothetical protein
MATDYRRGFLGPYISAVELEGRGPVTLTIERVMLERVAPLDHGDDEEPSRPRDRWVLYFEGTRDARGLLLNRTNAECMAAMYGPDVEQWPGRRITLHTVPVRVGPNLEPGIRIAGSPDLETALTFTLKLPRKKAARLTLQPTRAKERRPPSNETPPAEGVEQDQPETGATA